MSAMRKPWQTGVLALLMLGVAGCAAQAQHTAPQTIAVGGGGAAAPAPKPAVCAAKLPSTTTFPAVSGSTLVPDQPSVASVCRYAGLNDPHPQALVKSSTVTGTRLDQLVAAMNTGKPTPGGVYNCPMDSGAADVVQFGYSTTGPVDVAVDLNGCRGENNGHRTVAVPSTVQSTLTAMVGAPNGPTG
jgi:hypothetical protein